MSWPAFLTFDFRGARDQHGERVACDRVDSIAHAAPFLAAAHVVCGAILLLCYREAGAVPDPLFFGLPFAAILLLDLRLWLLTRRRARPTQPHRLVRLAALYAVLAALWLVTVAAKSRPGRRRRAPARARWVAGGRRHHSRVHGHTALVFLSARAGSRPPRCSPPDGVARAETFRPAVGLSMVRTSDASRRQATLPRRAGTQGAVVAAFEARGAVVWETNADARSLTYRPLARGSAR